MAALTVTIRVVELAHCPASGVKVAVTSLPAEGSILAGDQVPEIPLLEVVGRGIGASFWQRGPGLVKVGSLAVLTTTVMEVGLAHSPGSGVKVAIRL